MIEESLLKSGILGKDGFVWWIGRVAHSKYWKNENDAFSKSGIKGGRCKVRIIGYHPFDATLPEKDLPWASVMIDAFTGSGQGGLGQTLNLVGGETCIGFFLDGEEAQQPVVMGLLHRSANVKDSISENDIIQSGSSQFKTFTGFPGNVSGGTKRAPINTNPIAPGGTPGGANGGKPINACDAQYKGSLAAQGAEKRFTRTIVKPSNCGNDFIGQITRALQDFIGMISILDGAFGQFVDPLLNEIVDITNSIRNIAGQIAGFIKGIINNIRSGILKCIISLFKKFLGLNKKTNPTHPITNPAAEFAAKNIFEKIYCIFEYLFDEIIDFIVNMLTNLVGQVINGPLCAVEQFVSGILAKLMDMIEQALQPILSGISWLTGGISNIRSVLSQVSTLASQIYNLIGDCGGLKCKQPSQWVSSTATALAVASDDWKKQLKNINVLQNVSKDLTKINDALNSDVVLKDIVRKVKSSPGVFSVDYMTENGNVVTRQEDESGNVLFENTGGYTNTNQLEGILKTTKALGGDLTTIEAAIGTISLFGNGNSAFDACNQLTTNPQTQYDLSPVPLGYKFKYCIPPIAEVLGDGVGAKLIPIVTDGRVFSVEVINGGYGYTSPLPIAIVDNSGHGSGARATAIVENGIITGAIVLRTGYGYCGGNYNSIGIGTTQQSTTGISSSVVGIVTSIYVETPGIGYTSGDTISIGSTIATPLITQNGSIVKVNLPTNYNETFNTTPTIIINTTTGVGAKVIPVMKFTPQGTFVNENATTNIDQKQVINVVDCI